MASPSLTTKNSGLDFPFHRSVLPEPNNRQIGGGEKDQGETNLSSSNRRPGINKAYAEAYNTQTKEATTRMCQSLILNAFKPVSEFELLKAPLFYHNGNNGMVSFNQIFGSSSAKHAYQFGVSAITQNFNSASEIAQLTIGENGAFKDGYTFLDQLYATAGIKGRENHIGNTSFTAPSSGNTTTAQSDSPNCSLPSTQSLPVLVVTDASNPMSDTGRSDIPLSNNNDTSMTTNLALEIDRGVRSALVADVAQLPRNCFMEVTTKHITSHGKCPTSISVSGVEGLVGGDDGDDDDDNIPLSQLRRSKISSLVNEPSVSKDSGKVEKTPITSSPRKSSVAVARHKNIVSSPRRIADTSAQKKRQLTHDSEEEGDLLPSPKKSKIVRKKANASPTKKTVTYSVSKPSSDDSHSFYMNSDDSSESDDDNNSDLDTAYSSQRAQSWSPAKRHRNVGRDRKPGFSDEEYDAVFDAVYARRSWENANPKVVPLRDQPFWECILKNVHSKNQCTTRKSWGSLKNFWNRVGRERSQFEERVNGGKNGKLTASVQKPKKSTKRR